MFSRMNEKGFDFDGATTGGKKNTRDLFVEGRCDDNVIELVKLCGWEKEFNELTKEIHSQVEQSWKETNKTKAAVLTSPESKPEETSAKAAAAVSDSISEGKKEDKTNDLVEKLSVLGVKDSGIDDDVEGDSGGKL